jgi:hypothetical protein
MLKNLIKLSFRMLLNGVRRSHVTDMAMQVEENDGVYLLGSGAVLTIETKNQEELTPKQKLRKNLIITFIVSFLFMIILSTIGVLYPDAYVGRILVLLSEFPAFISALASTRIFMKRPKKKQMSTEDQSKLFRPPIVIPRKRSSS